MPVSIDLGRFPRLQCRRCGLVALVDPGLPPDVRPSILCPVCHIPMRAPRLVNAIASGAGVGGFAAERPVPAPGATRRALAGDLPARPQPLGRRTNRVPSNLAVGLALVGLLVVVLVIAFAILLVIPHHNYWEYLTR